MKATRMTVGIAALALMLGAICQANATANTNTLTFTGTMIVQGTAVDVGNVEINRVVRTPFTTKAILTMISTALGTNFPNGSTITVEGNIDSQPSFLVRGPGPDREALTNVTRFFTIALSQEVFSGRFNNQTRAETATDYFLVTISFDDGNGDSFTVSGVAVEIFRAGALGNGKQTITGNGSIPVSGTGRLDGRFGVITGKIFFRGRSVETD